MCGIKYKLNRFVKFVVYVILIMLITLTPISVREEDVVPPPIRCYTQKTHQSVAKLYNQGHSLEFILLSYDNLFLAKNSFNLMMRRDIEAAYVDIAGGYYEWRTAFCAAFWPTVCDSSLGCDDSKLVIPSWPDSS